MNGRREWVWRAVFEAALILVGLLGGLALNQWQDSRARQARADAMMTAIRAELQENLAKQEAASVHNWAIVSTFLKLAAEGAPFAPGSTYKGGVIQRPPLTSAAWDAARAGSAIDDMPVDRLLVLAAVYDAQREYVESTGTLLDMLYQKSMEPGVPIDRVLEPGRLGSLLKDYAGRSDRLIERYRATLDQLNRTDS